MTISNNPNMPEEKYEVTPLELFFDVVFVFAVSQLSHHLAENLTWRGTAETLVMLLAIFAIWFTTSWSATLVQADQARTRWLIFTVMLLSLFMNASVTRAFTTFGWTFVIPLLVIQLGRAIWMIVNSKRVNSGDAVFQSHYFRVLIWYIPSTPLWIVGAAVNPQARLLWWALATVIDQTGRLLEHPLPGKRFRSENVPFDADHMLERCRLFLIIALGETVFTAGMAIVTAPTTLMTLITGTFALVGTIALWSLTFGRSHRLTMRHLEKTKDPIRTSHQATNAVMGLVAGLIALAVANEEVIVHPYGHTTLPLSLLLGVGPLIFLLTQGWYLWVVPNVRSNLHFIGGIGLLILGFATQLVQPYIALILVGVSLALLALLDRGMTR
ncbi:MAG: low temperature requirement protein A [Anaerolineales bacterium]|jgi:low temperature requirement protein LtrA